MPAGGVRIAAATALIVLLLPGTGTAPCRSPGIKIAGREEPRAVLPTPVDVFVQWDPREDGVVYRYRIVNRSPCSIAQLLVGYDELLGESVIHVGPMGWNGDTAAAGAIQSPRGWHGDVIPTEGTDSLYIGWEVDSSTSVLRGGRTLPGFTVTVAMRDSGYEKGPWTVYMGDGPRMYYTGRLLPAGRQSRAR